MILVKAGSGCIGTATNNGSGDRQLTPPAATLRSLVGRAWIIFPAPSSIAHLIPGSSSWAHSEHKCLALFFLGDWSSFPILTGGSMYRQYLPR